MSFLFGKEKKETEKEEYERLLKEKKGMEERDKMVAEKYFKPAIEKSERFGYLDKKFNPKSVYDDKPDIFQKVKPRNKILTENKIITLKKQNPKISLEEAILRTFGPTRDIYEDEEIIKLFKLEKYHPKPPPLQSSPKRSSPKKSKSKSPPKPPPLQLSPKRSSPKKSKSKSPPKPHPLPSSPKRSSPKKSKSRSPPKIKPDDPNYYLEMAFRNLEKN